MVTSMFSFFSTTGIMSSRVARAAAKIALLSVGTAVEALFAVAEAVGAVLSVAVVSVLGLLLCELQ